VDIGDAPHTHTPSLDPKAHPVHRNRELVSSSINASQPTSGPYSTSAINSTHNLGAINSTHNLACDTIDDLSQLKLAPRIISAKIQQQPDIHSQIVIYTTIVLDYAVNS
jgi:hypothetical protein